MSYTALYRKYRPKTFEEVVGQEHITRTLKNQIISGRVGHAYLLNGGRGTGKTSTAKILARAINCLNPQDGNPCNECEICKSALNGSLTDIVEMDAASNNSVEDIRAIRDEVNFLPTVAKYRVYIIDEVHMLSIGAFNALLKTLEEPPAHVKFILATTEPQKLPATILSRCQRFDFKRISNEDIIKRLEIVCKESNIEVTEGALKIIAVLAEGAMRDAISILERCLQEGTEIITNEQVKELVGIPKLESVNKIINDILEYNIDDAIKDVNETLADGKDISNLIWEIIKYVKDILIYKTTKKLDLYNAKELEQIQTLAEKSTKERLLNIIFFLSDLSNEIKMTTQKTIMFQAGIIKLCSKEVGTGGNVEERLEKIENYLRAGGGVARPQTQGTQKKITNASTNTSAIAGIGKDKKPAQYWQQVVNNFKQSGRIMLYTNLLNTNAGEIYDITVGIEFPKGITPFGKTVLEKPENKIEISNQVSIACGKTMQIKYIDTKPQDSGEESEESELSNFANKFDIPFDIIE